MRSWQGGMVHLGNNGMENEMGAKLNGSGIKEDRD